MIIKQEKTKNVLINNKINTLIIFQKKYLI